MVLPVSAPASNSTSSSWRRLSSNEHSLNLLQSREDPQSLALLFSRPQFLACHIEIHLVGVRRIFFAVAPHAALYVDHRRVAQPLGVRISSTCLGARHVEKPQA